MTSFQRRISMIACFVLLAGCGGGAPVDSAGNEATDSSTANGSASAQPAAGNKAAAQAADKSPAKQPPRTPATTAQAAKVLDLRTFPVLEGADKPSRTLASLGYQVAAKPKQAFQFQKEALEKLGFQELKGSQATEQFANGAFQHKDGYLVSVSASSLGEPGEVMVTFHSHGNVPLNQLPVPKLCKLAYEFPATIMYTAEKQETTAEEVLKLLDADLREKGWKPYGQAGDAYFYHQNAILISARVFAAPGQDNKVTVTYGTELMSAEIPAPEETKQLQYSESTKTLSLETAMSEADLVKFYQAKLGESGWKSTTDNAVEVGIRKVVIFRNPGKEMIELRMTKLEDGLRALVRYQTAAEVEKLEKLLKEKADKAIEKANQPDPEVAIKLPAGAEVTKSDKRDLEFTVAQGKAKASVEAIRKSLLADGWKEEDAMLQDAFGTISLKRESQSLSITYVETGFTPSEITISGFGLTLKQAK